MPPPVIRFELDITGTNPNNRVIDEPHTVNTLTPVRSIVPTYGPFFAESLIVRSGATTLTRGVDYQIVELHQEATLKYGKEISSVILILNSTLGPNFTITYQVLGGHYTYSDEPIANLYEAVINDNRPVDWANIINKPDVYPPTLHRHLMDDLYGFEYIVDYLERIKRAITLGQTAIVLDIINTLLTKFKCKEPNVVLPTKKLISHDALMYVLSKRKIISNISVDVVQCDNYKAQSLIFVIDTSNLPNNTPVYWYLTVASALYSITSGVVYSTGSETYVSIYIPSIDGFVDDPLYIGVKLDPNSYEFDAVTYRLSFKEVTYTTDNQIYYMYTDTNELFHTAEIISYAEDDEKRIFYYYYRWLIRVNSPSLCVIAQGGRKFLVSNICTIYSYSYLFYTWYFN